MTRFVNLISLSLIPLLVHAQPGPALPTHWTVVQSLPPGAKLIGQLSGGRPAKGEFAQATSTELTIFIDGHSVDFDRVNISRIYRVAAARKARAAAIGAAVFEGSVHSNLCRSSEVSPDW